MYAITAIIAIGAIINANGIIRKDAKETKTNPQTHHIKKVNFDILIQSSNRAIMTNIDF